ncbi:MAG: Fe-S cluster assembly transcription factor [Pseudomonadota bacterium]
MRLTTKGRFAVTAMLDLALHHAQGPVTLAGIGRRESISLSYLEQLFGKLRRRALVESVRGPGGGYRLARPAGKISVSEIIRAVDEPLDTTQCGGMENCKEARPCITHNLWATLNEKLSDYLNSVTLQDLLTEYLAKNGNVAVLMDHRRATMRKAVSLPV